MTLSREFIIKYEELREDVFHLRVLIRNFFEEIESTNELGVGFKQDTLVDLDKSMVYLVKAFNSLQLIDTHKEQIKEYNFTDNENVIQITINSQIKYASKMVYQVRVLINKIFGLIGDMFEMNHILKQIDEILNTCEFIIDTKIF